MTQTTQNIVLFNQENPDTIAKLIHRRTINEKLNAVTALWRLYHGEEQQKIVTSIREQVHGKTTELSPVYIPISQIGQLENLKVPLLYKEDGVIEEQIQIILSAFFPNCTINKREEVFELSLDSREARRLFYFTNLYKQNEAWEPFLSEHFSFAFSMAREADSYIQRRFRENNFFRTQKELVVVQEDERLNYDKIILTIPFEMKKYYSLEGSSPSNLNNLYEYLQNMISFSYRMHFVADTYPHMAKSLSEELERERTEYAEKQTRAITAFEKELKARTYPVEVLDHKSAVEFANKNGITEIMLPFSNKEAFTTTKGVMLALYNRNRSSNSTDWLLAPPTKEPHVATDMQYHGIHEYVSFDTASPMSMNGKAPHVISEENRFNTAIDTNFFMDVLMSSYADNPAIGPMKNTLLFLEKFPKAFSKVDASVLPQRNEEAADFDFSAWVQNRDAKDRIRKNPLEFLSYQVGSENRVVQVGKVVRYVGKEHALSDFLNDSLFRVEKISVNKNSAAQEEQLVLSLQTLLSKTFRQTEDLSSFEMVLEGKDFNLVTISDIQGFVRNTSIIWNNSLSILNTCLQSDLKSDMKIYQEESGLVLQTEEQRTRQIHRPGLSPFHDYDDDDDEEHYDDDEDYEDDEDDEDEGDYDDTPVEVAPQLEPVPVPLAPARVLDVSSRPYLFVYSVEASAVIVYHNGEEVCRQDSVADHEARSVIESIIRERGGNTFLNGLNVETIRPFVLPIHSLETSRVIASTILF